MGFLSKKIFDFTDDAVGLSIGNDEIRVVHMKDKKIKSYSSVHIPEKVLADGEIINKDELARIIKKALDEARPKRIKTKKIRIALSEEKSFLRLISMPHMEEKEINEAIKWEIEANIPLTLNQVYYDWQTVGDIFSEEKDQTRVLVLAASRRVVDQYLEILESFGLEVIGIESETTALVKSLINEGIKIKTSLIINIDKSKTSFIFAIKNIPCFTSSIPISEETIIGAIAKKFNISDKKAKEIEEKDGIGSFFEDDALFAAIKPILDGLVDETKKTMDFYLEGLKYSPSIDRIIICGKMSKSKGLIPYLSKSLAIEVVEGDVRDGTMNSSKDLPIIEKNSAIIYATAIGLAIGNNK